MQSSQAGSLVARIRAGGEGAREAEATLCAELLPIARLFAIRHAGLANSEDVAQDALVAVLEAVRSGRVREEERPAAFLAGVVRNLGRTRARSSTRARAASARLDAEAHTPPREPTVDPRRLWSCFNLLAARSREVLARTFARGEDGSEIARALGIREDNVRAVRHRALAQLHACIEKGATSR